MGKLILRFDDDIGDGLALEYAAAVVRGGRISYNPRGEQFCYHTSFKDGTEISAFKPSKTTDTLVIYRKALPTKEVIDESN